jgi:hypothetical protein
MRLMSKSLSALGLAASGLVANACGNDTEESLPTSSSQTEWSDLAEKDRSSIRSFLEYFGPGGGDGIDLRSASSVIVGEGIRNFAGNVGVSSLVLSGRNLDMTAETVLPESGPTGVYEPTGGFVSFDEVAYDADGEETRSETVRKRGRGFDSGSIDDFGYSKTVDSPRPDYVLSTERQSFRVSKDVKYVETLWNQAIEWTSRDDEDGQTPPFGQKFEYQSQPSMVLTLKAGNRLAISRDQTDRIVSESVSTDPQIPNVSAGWETRSTAKTEGKLTGTLTLFRPKRDNVPENDDAPRPTETERETNEGKVTERSVGTSLESSSGPMPSDPSIEQTITVRTTLRSEAVSDANDGSLERRESETHRTTWYRFSRAGADEDTASASLAERDYEVTTRELTVVTVTKGLDRTAIETVTTIYRYTDQPGVRNNLREWMSTRSVTEVEDVFVGGEITTKTTFGGTEWLTDQVEIDPEFSEVPFTFDGTVEQVTESVGRFFGADNSGIELDETNRLVIDLRTSFGDEQIGMVGSSVQRESSLQVEGVGAHQLSGDGDGTFEVTVGDKTIVASSEEWRDALVPPGTLLSWLELAAPPGPIPAPAAIDAAGGDSGGGDETCRADEALCPSNGGCIAVTSICDGFPDCAEGEDEVDCGQPACEPGETRCSDGTCISENWVCDGSDDCADGGDEADCDGSVCEVDASIAGQGAFTCSGFDACGTFAQDFCECFVLSVFPEPDVCEAYIGAAAQIDTCFAGGVTAEEMLQSAFDALTNNGLTVESATFGVGCRSRPAAN